MGNIFRSLFSAFGNNNQKESEEKNVRKNFDILKYDGIRAQQIGKTAYAIKCYTEALSLLPDLEVANYLVSLYTSVNQYDQALEVINNLLVSLPEEPDALYLRAYVYHLMKEEEKAVVDCEGMLQIVPENIPAYLLLAKSRKNLGDYLGAIAALTKALAVKEDLQEAYLLRTEVLCVLEQYTEALSDIEKLIELQPEEELAYLFRGKIMEQLNKNEVALTDYQQAMELNPFNMEAPILYGSLLLKLEKTTEAIAFYDEIIEIHPDFAKAYAERGRAKNMQGDKEGALEDLKKSLELDPQGENAQKFEGKHANFDDLYKGGIF
ncbi:MAG: tetratricopeptide repeat protein [Tannerellaceae bacterium]|nr:tetratricopeptide repeat protein [Tannerellaceae bacterium]